LRLFETARAGMLMAAASAVKAAWRFSRYWKWSRFALQRS
jgi:hypothetical protein